MRNLFALLWKYHLFILLLFLESLSVTLIVRNNNYQQASFINSANLMAAGLYKTVNGITEYINLKKVNKTLADENARLRLYTSQAVFTGRSVTDTIIDSLYWQQYSFIETKVINNSTNKRNNYLTLNKGILQGLKPEMGVIGSNGIVGIVKDVSEHYSTVMSVLHKNFHTSAKLKNNNYFGNLEWDGGVPTRAIVTDIPIHVKLLKGDTMVTNAYSAIYPEGILIGTIEAFKIKPGENFYTITLNLTTDFSNLSYVYVIDNLLKNEQRSIEFKATADDH